MALNLKNVEVERLAAEVASLAGESKTEAIRRALEDRRDRLSYRLGGVDRGQRLRDLLEHEIWPMIPRGLLGPAAARDAGEGTRASGLATAPMIVDGSALLDVLFRAAGHDRLLDVLATAKGLGIGAPTLADLGAVLCSRTKRDARAILSRFLQECEAQTVSFGESHWRVGLDAYLRYGEGRHAASLSLGDCLTYAVAKLAAQPLLTTTAGFSRTDLQLA